MSPSRVASFAHSGRALALLLAAALLLRILIAWVWWPQSGFFLDLELNADWVRVLSEGGWARFYRADAPYFIDYPPAYFFILSALGWMDATWIALSGGESIVIGLLKLPPIVADVAAAGVLALIARRMVGPAAALPAAALFAFNPAVIFDSAVYGQNDSIGAFIVLLGVHALISGRTELAGALAVLATLVKFQFGFFIPIVLVVGLRRHLRVDPVRVMTSLAAALVVLVIVLQAFNLALFDPVEPARSLWHRFAAASEAFPGITQNAFNLWMNPLFEVVRSGSTGIVEGRVVPDDALLLSLGPVGVTWQLVGGLLFGVAVAIALRLVAKRPDAVAIVAAVFLVSVALYMFPTRIHERYLVPALAMGVPFVILRARGWTISWVVLSAVAFFSIYFVYTLPNLNRHLGRDPVASMTVLSVWGIYALSFAGLVATMWIAWRAWRMGDEAAPDDRPEAKVVSAPAGPRPEARQSVMSRPVRRVAARPGVTRATLLMLASISVAAALVSARVSFGAEGWLWNLDLPKIHFPWAVIFHEALMEGRLPLWSDRLGMGFPLYAEGQIGAFYPPNWFIFRLEPLVAMDATRLLHLAFAGVGTGLLALRVSGSRPGAVVALLVVVLGGAITTKLEWWNLVAAYGWMPWVMLPLAGRRPPTRQEVVLAAAAWGVQALAGHPNTWLLTGVGAALLLIRGPLVPAFSRTAAFGVIGACVGAVQIVPTLLLQVVSVRARGLSADDLFTSASTPFDLLGLGFANAFIRSGADGAWDFATTWYPDGIFALLEAGVYVGLPVIALAAMGSRTLRARRWLVLAAIAVAVGAVAALRPEWWQAIPVLNGLRSPVRAYLLLTLAIAILAAIGVARFGRRPDVGRAGIGAMAAVAVAYVVTIVLARSLPPVFDWLLGVSTSNFSPESAPDVRVRALAAMTAAWPVALEAAIALATAVFLLRPRASSTVAALVILAALPLALLSPAANPVRPASDLDYAGSPLVSTLARLDPGRVLTISPPGYYSGMPNQLAAAGVPDVDMFSSLNLLANDDLVRKLREADHDGALRRAVGVDLVVTFDAQCPGSEIAVVTEDRARICRVDGTLSPPYWLPRSVGEGEVDPAAIVQLHQPVTVVTDSTNLVTVRTAETDAGWVYFDRSDWHAWATMVDGTPATSVPELGGQLVEVPAGNHEVRMELAARDALAGLGAGIVALIAGVAWIGWGGRGSTEPVRGRRPHAPEIDEKSHADGQ